MAAGKSVVGRKLAHRLKRGFVDLDRAIELREGMKVREIFKVKGEAYFRELERLTLGELLRRDGLVIATGGGVVMDEENLDLLKRQCLLICLKATPEMLLKRSGRGEERPLLKGGDRKERIAKLLKQREERYDQAHLSIDTTALSLDEVVENILEAIGNLTAPSPLPSPSGKGRG